MKIYNIGAYLLSLVHKEAIQLNSVSDFKKNLDR